MTRIRTHPGKVLSERLSNVGETVEQFAGTIDVPVDELLAVLDEQAPVTDNLAEKLTAKLNTSKTLWIDLQAKHDKTLHAYLIEEIERLWDSAPGTEDGDRLTSLIIECEKLEDRLYPLDDFPADRQQPAPQKREGLNELLDGINDDNEPESFDTPPSGNELI